MKKSYFIEGPQVIHAGDLLKAIGGRITLPNGITGFDPVLGVPTIRWEGRESGEINVDLNQYAAEDRFVVIWVSFTVGLISIHESYIHTKLENIPGSGQKLKVKGGLLEVAR